MDDLDHILTEEERHGADVHYTDDFLLFGNDPHRLWDLKKRLEAELPRLRLRLSFPKSRLLTTREGVSLYGFVFRTNQSPRVCLERRSGGSWESSGGGLASDGYRKRRSWSVFSREGNSLGIRKSLGNGIFTRVSPPHQ